MEDTKDVKVCYWDYSQEKAKLVTIYTGKVRSLIFGIGDNAPQVDIISFFMDDIVITLNKPASFITQKDDTDAVFVKAVK